VFCVCGEAGNQQIEAGIRGIRKQDLLKKFCRDHLLIIDIFNNLGLWKKFAGTTFLKVRPMQQFGIFLLYSRFYQLSFSVSP